MTPALLFARWSLPLFSTAIASAGFDCDDAVRPHPCIASCAGEIRAILTQIQMEVAP